MTSGTETRGMCGTVTGVTAGGFILFCGETFTRLKHCICPAENEETFRLGGGNK